MDKFIIVEYIFNYEKDAITKFMNETKHECLICYSKLNSVDIIMENHFCDCYHMVLLCGKCFKNWYMNDTKCFICRNKYMNYDEKEIDNIFIINPIFRIKHSLKCKDFDEIRTKFLASSRSIVTPHTNDIGVPIDMNLQQDIENMRNEIINEGSMNITTNQNNNQINNINLDKCKEGFMVVITIIFITSISFFITYLSF